MRTAKIHYLLISAMAMTSGTACSDMAPPTSPPVPADIQNRYNSGFNRIFVNGRQTDGKQINGTLLNGRHVSGRPVQGIFENNVLNSEIVSLGYVDSAMGITYRGPDLIGTEVTGQLKDGSTRQLRFTAHDAITVPGTNLYLVKYVDSGESVCGNRDGQPIWAAILPQEFDENTGNEIASDLNKYTFSCRFGAIQKCQEIGYLKNGTGREMKNGINKVRKLNDYHAACVRMLRADYCGDGNTHTFDGDNVDYYDHLVGSNGAETGTTGQDGFYFESEWDSDGAHCLNITRWMPSGLSGQKMNQSSENPDWEYVRLNCPSRFSFPVPKASGGSSVPDRACGSSSNWNTVVGFDAFAENTATQPGRSKIRTNTMLNTYSLQ
jgi:hypothetical protein